MPQHNSLSPITGGELCGATLHADNSQDRSSSDVGDGGDEHEYDVQNWCAERPPPRHPLT